MGGIFEDVNLEDLAGSESPIIDQKDLTLTEPVKEKNIANTAKEDLKITQPEITDGVDLDELKEAGAITEISKKEGKEGETKEHLKAPATEQKGLPLSSQDTFTSLASALTEAGAFTSLEEEELKEIKDVNTLMSAISKQIQNNEFATLNEEQKKYLEATKAGVPLENYSQRKATAAQYNNLDDEKIKNAPAVQRELIKRNFLIKGFDIQTAEKYADRSIAAESGLEDAINAKKSLVAHEESLLQAEIDEAKETKRLALETEKLTLEKLKSKVNETPEVIKGIKVNSTTKDRIFNSMTTPVDIDGDDPLNEVMKLYKEDSEYRLKMHALHVITDGFTDFSKFKQTSKSSAVKDLENKLNQTGTGKTGLTNSSTNEFAEGQTTKDIAKALENIKF